ncbi:MAG: hypothetical protein IKJ69_04090 [Clostridia bacterium]|nr:hypothetical protein [Clostridia bacterium]
MWRSTLGFFERRHLEALGENDAENAFEDFESGKNYDAANIKMRSGNHTAVSAFMFEELSRYVCERDALFDNRLCVYSLPAEAGNGKKQKKIKTIIKALEDIDICIGECVEKSEKAAKEQCIECDALLSKRKSLSDYGERKEIQALYNNRMAEIEEKYGKIISINEVDVFSLLNEKIRIIELARVRLNAIFDKRMLRIHTYYKAARATNPFLPGNCISGQKLMELNNESILGEYDAILDSLRTERDRIAAKQACSA